MLDISEFGTFFIKPLLSINHPFELQMFFDYSPQPR